MSKGQYKGISVPYLETKQIFCSLLLNLQYKVPYQKIKNGKFLVKRFQLRMRINLKNLPFFFLTYTLFYTDHYLSFFPYKYETETVRQDTLLLLRTPYYYCQRTKIYDPLVVESTIFGGAFSFTMSVFVSLDYLLNLYHTMSSLKQFYTRFPSQ